MKLVSNHKLFEDFFDEVEVDVRDDQVVIEEEPYREDYDYICYIKTIAPENAVAGKLYLDNTFSMFNNADISPVKIIKVDYNMGLDDYTNKPIDNEFCYYYVFYIKGKMSFKEFMFLIKFIKSSKFGAKLMNDRPYVPEIAVLKYLGEGLNNYYDFLIHGDLEDVGDKLDKIENYVYYYSVYVPQKSYDKITEMHQLLNIANILLKPEDIHKLFDSINVSDKDYLEQLELINGSESKITNLEFIANVDWQSNMNDSDEYQKLLE